MKAKMNKYLKILFIELEDIVIDLEFSEKIFEKRFKEHEITEYVFLENNSLLKREILGVEKLKKYLKKVDKEIVTVSELRVTVDEYFKDEVKNAGLPNVVYLLVSRKLDKIDKYINLKD